MTISKSLFAAVAVFALLSLGPAPAHAAAVDAPDPAPGVGPVESLVGHGVTGPSSASSLPFETSSSPPAVVDGFNFGAPSGGETYAPPATVSSAPPLAPQESNTDVPPAGLAVAEGGQLLPPIPGSQSDASTVAQPLHADTAALFGIELSPSQADHDTIRIGDDPQTAIISGLIFGLALAGAFAWHQRRSPLPPRR